MTLFGGAVSVFTSSFTVEGLPVKGLAEFYPEALVSLTTAPDNFLIPAFRVDPKSGFAGYSLIVESLAAAVPNFVVVCL